MPISRIKSDGIQDEAITSAKIGVDVIAAEDLAANSVTVAEISNGAVTSAKLDTNIEIAGTLGVGGATPSSFNAGANNLVVGSGTGSEGITIHADSSSNSAIFFADGTSGATTYTGQLNYQHASDSMTFHTNGGTEQMRIDNDGHVIIGSGGLDVSGIGGTYTALNMRAGAGYPVIYGQTTATTTNSSALQIIGATSGASAGGAAEFLGVMTIQVESDSSTSGNGYMNFYTSQSGTLGERMRIGSNGSFGIGTTLTADEYRVRIEPANVDGTSTAPTSGLYVRSSTSSSTYYRCAMTVACHGYYTQTRGHNGIMITNADSNTTRTAIGVQMLGSSGATVGSIRHNDNGTSYNTTSDYRLKENVVDLEGAIERLNQLQPRRFNFISDENDTVVDGFLAHEVSDIIPEAVSGVKDAVETDENDVPRLDSDGNQIPQYQQIDQAKLVPLLTAALQEAVAKIEALETRIAALESA